MSAPTNDRRELLAAVLVEHSRCRMADHDADGAQFDCGLIVLGPMNLARHHEHVAAALAAALAAQEGERGGAEAAADERAALAFAVCPDLTHTIAEGHDVCEAATDALVARVAGALAKVKAEVWDEAAEATADWMANNPSPSGIPHDPPRNPYDRADRIAGDQ